MPNQTLYGSNADRLRKAMLQRSKPTLPGSLHSFMHSYDEISVDPLHASMATFTTLSSSSSESTDSCASLESSRIAPSTAPSSSIGSQTHVPLDTAATHVYPSMLPSQQSSQHTLYRKNRDFDHVPSISTTSLYMGSPQHGGPAIGSPTTTSHSSSEYSRFGRVVTASLNSFSSIESEDKRDWAGPKRLFEKSPQNYVSSAAPVLVMPASSIKALEEEVEVQSVISEYEDMHLANHSAYPQEEYYTSYSKPRPRARKAFLDSSNNQAGSSNNRRGFSSFTNQSRTPNKLRAMLSTPSFYDNCFGNHSEYSLNGQDTKLSGPSPDNTTYASFTLESLDEYPGNGGSVASLNQRLRPRANSASSAESVYEHPRRFSIFQDQHHVLENTSVNNSFMQSGTALNLDLDNVIHNALVESSMFRASSRIDLVDKPNLATPEAPSATKNVTYLQESGMPGLATPARSRVTQHLPVTPSPTHSNQLPIVDYPLAADLGKQWSSSEESEDPSNRIKKGAASRFGQSMRKLAKKITNEKN